MCHLAFLIWLLCVGISAVLIGYCLKNYSNPIRKEGFAVYTCPAGTNSFVTNSGETQCCNGDVVDGYCTGDLRCTLSPKSKSGLPTCTDLAASDAASAGASKCPQSMSHYFGCPTTIEGCSASPPSANGLQPSDPLQPQCILYKTQAEDLVKLDSCYNVMQNSQKEARCAVAEATANLPACAKAASDLAKPASASGGSCSPPPLSNFVIYGDWIGGGRIPVQERYTQANGNIVYAIQQGQHVKMVVTDKNNITITARNYVGSISQLNTRASDMPKVNALGDSSGHYILGTAP